MSKKEYKKPVAMDLSSIEMARGSCYSGSGEKNLTGCQSGDVAVDPCEIGSEVLPRTVCSDGGYAGASCFNGTNAG